MLVETAVLLAAYALAVPTLSLIALRSLDAVNMALAACLDTLAA